MTAARPFFARPSAKPVALRVRPRLASWMAVGHRDQIRLEEYLKDTEELIRPRLDELTGPLALSLDVGLPSDTPLLDQHDLDNYLLPLMIRLDGRGERFVSAWVTKRHADTSYLSVAEATCLEPGPVGGACYTVRTSASIQSSAFKWEIHEQLADAPPLAEGAVALHVSFVVGPRRSWRNLWKPTIDALERLLGRSTPERRWHPRDGRIVELGLHSRVDPAAGHDVVIVIDAATANA